MLDYIEYLNLPTKVVIVLAAAYLVMNLVGSILDFRGKVVPEFINLKKYFRRKKAERETMREMVELMPTLKEVPVVLREAKETMDSVNSHYGTDNIAQRNDWIQSVNSKLSNHDENIQIMREMLTRNNADTLALLIESKRTAILDFASLVVDGKKPVTREQFHRIFRLHEEYEEIISENGMTNGEVDIAIRIINESYEKHLRDHSFVEDIRGYDV